MKPNIGLSSARLRNPISLIAHYNFQLWCSLYDMQNRSREERKHRQRYGWSRPIANSVQLLSKLKNIRSNFNRSWKMLSKFTEISKITTRLNINIVYYPQPHCLCKLPEIHFNFPFQYNPMTV